MGESWQWSWYTPLFRYFGLLFTSAVLVKILPMLVLVLYATSRSYLKNNGMDNFKTIIGNQYVDNWDMQTHKFWNSNSLLSANRLYKIVHLPHKQSICTYMLPTLTDKQKVSWHVHLQQFPIHNSLYHGKINILKYEFWYKLANLNDKKIQNHHSKLKVH